MASPSNNDRRPLLTNANSSYGATGKPQLPVQLFAGNDSEVVDRVQQIIAMQAALQPKPGPIQATEQKALSLSGGQYIGDIQNGVPHGRGKVTYHPGGSGKFYDGEWKDGKFHGKGLAKFTNGESYEGQFEYGLRHGYGCNISSDGSKYEGNYVRDKREGQGTLQFASGDVYTGQWKNGKHSGQGKYTCNNGDYYDGEWLDGKRHGRGYQVLVGNVFNGDFRNDQLWEGERTGRTNYIYRDGVGKVDYSEPLRFWAFIACITGDFSATAITACVTVIPSGCSWAAGGIIAGVGAGTSVIGCTILYCCVPGCAEIIDPYCCECSKERFWAWWNAPLE